MNYILIIVMKFTIHRIRVSNIYGKVFTMIEVNRHRFWLELFNTKINGKVLNVIQNMYSNIKSCVSCKLNGDLPFWHA